MKLRSLTLNAQPDDDELMIVMSEAQDFHGTGTTTQPRVDRPGKEAFALQMLACFSLNRNIPKIFNFKTSSDAVPILDGMRVLSMWWVIYGHVYWWMFVNPIDNILITYDYIKNPWFQVIINGEISVDSFFYISGFLVAFGYV